jgi:SAM-dependent methyltransferase
MVAGLIQRQSPKNWFTTGLGNRFQATAAMELARILPRAYFSVALDLGPGTVKYSDHLDAGLRFNINSTQQNDARHRVIGDWDSLPLGRNSVDLVVMQHTLDFSIDPRQVLREALEVLTAEGWIVICGFNPLGLWGVSRMLFQSGGKMPWSAGFLRSSRVQDWLTLLGAQVVGGSYFFYRPPVNSLRLLNRLDVLEHIGRRWWPTLSGAYLIVAQKKQIDTIHVRQRFSVSRRQATGALHSMRAGPATGSGSP